MGLFSNAKAVKEVERIRKSGGTAKLSVSQIVNMVVNLPDASRNLSREQFKQVYALFSELNKDKNQMELTYDGYLKVASKIIGKFDEIAPFSQYCGDRSFY